MRSMVNEAKLTIRFKTEDYSHEEYTLGAVVDEKESGAEVLAELKKQINGVFSGEVSEKAVEEKPAKKAKKEEKKDVRSSKASVANDEDSDDEDSASEDAGDDGESDQDDEASDSEDGNDGDDSADDAEESDSSEDSEESSSKPSKSSKGSGKSEKSGGKKFVQKPQKYNREIEQHKDIFGGLLRSVAPDWKKSDAGKEKAKSVSKALAGEPFLDENGEVIESFKNAVKKYMAPSKKAK